MKRGVIALSGFAWLQLAAAACCRTNKCLKAVASSPLGDGLQDCSSILVETVTPAATTVTETVTVVSTEHNTLVDTAVFTETVTTTAATETQLFTLGTTVTASTYTDVETITETVLATVTTQSVVTTTAPAPTSRVYPVKARGDTILSPSPSPSIPSYASADCPSWEKYVLACECAGVTPTTVTAEAQSTTTITVSATGNAVTLSVPSTVSTTETLFVSVTATTAATEFDTVLVTATTSVTESVVVTSTIAVTETVTEAVTPSGPTCRPAIEIGNFRVVATEYNGPPQYLEASSRSPIWRNAPHPTQPNNDYTWGLDSEGYLVTGDNTAYIHEIGLGATRARFGHKDMVQNLVRDNPDVYSHIKGCVNSVTGELTLSAKGRTTMLDCNAALVMAFGLGYELGSSCFEVFPKIAP